MNTPPLFSKFTGLYSLSKTLRFGLTLSNAPKKNRTHQIFKELVADSETRFREGTKQHSEMEEARLITNVTDTLSLISTYLKDWEGIYQRTDQIALTKDFYRRMARKARFDGFWELEDRYGKKKKHPQTQLIDLSALGKEYQGTKRSDYILGYWADNLRKAKQKRNDFEAILDQYKYALSDAGRAHTKPNAVQFRKAFLSLLNIVSETLVPLNNDSITFPGLEKLAENDRNQQVLNFAGKQGREARKALLDRMTELRAYFEENGGYVPYGKATLNRYTAEQKPHIFKQEIDKLIEKLGIADLAKRLLNLSDDDLQTHLEFKELNKIKELVDSHLSLIERMQLFKYKTIPVAIRYTLADYLHRRHGLDKEKTLHLFSRIGQPVSVGEVYKNAADKEEFELNRFPLKPAFDYAWENLARYSRNPGASGFPERQCRALLKDVFQVEPDRHEGFRLYADLLFVKENLAALEHEQNSPVDREKHIERVRNTLKGLRFTDGARNYEGHQTAVIRWIGLDGHMQEQLRKDNAQPFKNYEKAKQQFGLLRGKQKNDVRIYKNLTETYKDLAMIYGRDFANLRDKLNEENELNKIAHFGLVVEDANRDRYLLLSAPLNEHREEAIEALLREDREGELKTYRVKSLTSKTLEKLVKNEGGYKDFHIPGKALNRTSIKQDWPNYQNDPAFLASLKVCLENSKMARAQQWSEFGFDFSKCNSYEALAREVDQKGHLLKEGRLSVASVEKLVREKGCLLFPVVNQDITSKKRELKNQFSKDWENLFAPDNDYRLHPEFRLSYRHPSPHYPAGKRYSRFQMVVHLLCEFIPRSGNYLSRKEQVGVFNDQEKMQQAVADFNAKLEPGNDFYVLGIDRGLKQLATLCVLNRDGQIQGGFKVYTRCFDSEKKEWRHSILEERNLLDLSNLRVETTVDGEKVLVDLHSVKVKDEQGNYTRDNRQKVRLKQLAYIRKLQFQMQHNPEAVMRFIEQYGTEEAIAIHIGELITPYKEGKHFDDLPTPEIMDMLSRFRQFENDKDERSKRELVELDAADDLKAGVVANMVGVVAWLLERYRYQAFVSLENLTRSFLPSRDGLSTAVLSREMDFMEQENLALAGLGTYHYFEMQLLKKLQRIQQENHILHLVPVFRSGSNYETVRMLSKKTGDAEYTCKPFGHVHFVDPCHTSKRCAVCGSTSVSRTKKNDAIVCKSCSFETGSGEEVAKKNQVILNAKGKIDMNLHYIQNADENGAYHIALKTLKNLTNP